MTSFDTNWGIGHNARSWHRDEIVPSPHLLHAKAEMLDGQLGTGIEQRLLLGGCVLKILKMDMAERLEDLKTWKATRAARTAEIAGSDKIERRPENLVVSKNLATPKAGSPADLDVGDAVLPSTGRTWNYRVLEFRHGEDAWQAIHEVHYRDGRAVAYGETAAVLMWDPENGVLGGLRCLELMKDAMLKPVLTEHDFRGLEPAVADT